MPKYFCEYCGIYLTHSSPGGRNQHSRGRKHINNKIEYYSQILYEFQQNISDNLVKMTSHFLNKPNNQQKSKTDDNNQINPENKEQTQENLLAENSNDIPIKKTMIHIPGQMPLSVPLQYVPNIPINEKIMKAIPNKLLQPQYKKFNNPQDDISKREIIDINEGENADNNNKNISITGKNKDKNAPKTILENLKRMKYSYNDPNPENNEHLLVDLLKNEEEEDEQTNKNN